MFPKFPLLGDNGGETFHVCSADASGGNAIGAGGEGLAGVGGYRAVNVDGEEETTVEGVVAVAGSEAGDRKRSGAKLLGPEIAIGIGKRESIFSTRPISP